MQGDKVTGSHWDTLKFVQPRKESVPGKKTSQKVTQHSWKDKFVALGTPEASDWQQKIMACD